MKNVTAFLLIAFAATASNAEVINLEGFVAQSQSAELVTSRHE